MATLYQNAYRATLEDDSDIEALEAQRTTSRKLAEQGIDPTGDQELDTELTEAPKNAEEETFKQRYGNLRRHQAKKDAEHKEALAALQRQLDNLSREQVKLPKSEDEIAAWVAEYPDVAKIVESIAMKKSNERFQEVEARFKEVEDLKRENTREKAYVKLLKAHPDFEEIRADQGFHDWAQQQSRTIQIALYENDSDWQSAADAVSFYKLATGHGKKKPGPKPRTDFEAAESTPRGSRSELTHTEGKKRWKESEIAKLKPREYELYEDEIELANREGRIIMDLSASAAM